MSSARTTDDPHTIAPQTNLSIGRSCAVATADIPQL